VAKYTIVLEKEEHNWCAYCPDVPGCFTTGKDRETTIANMAEALKGHLEWMLEDGDKIPAPSDTYIASVDVDISIPAIEA
jgi:predicted RNase H-like HicB family nuclease